MMHGPQKLDGMPLRGAQPEAPRQALEQALFGRNRRDGATEGGHDLRPEALSAASGITDPTLLAQLVAAGIDGETLTALSLAPLVAVAWADGALDERERAALLRAAADSGLERDGAAFRLLEEWLAEPPPAMLVEAWQGYIREQQARMEPGAALALRLHLLGRARRVAEAAGGLLGHAPQISAAEQAMLERLEQSFAA